MVRDLLKDGEVGRFFRGNLHCHSNRSDGLLQPDEVVGAYRDAGYDFICLSDHFEAEYGWHITDTRPLRDEHFTTIVGAELSSAPWDERDAMPTGSRPQACPWTSRRPQRTTTRGRSGGPQSAERS